MTLDVAKAAQIMREAGLSTHAGRNYAAGYALRHNPFQAVSAHEAATTGTFDGVSYTADEMDALAARLVWTAALCRRIDAECRGAPAPEPQCARDVTVTWAPGPGAPLGPRGVVPGDPSTYPAEGEPVAPHDTEGRP